MRRLLAYPRRYSTPVVLLAAAATFAALAVTANGFPVQHVNLNDGGIWVTNDAAGAIGRFNKPIAQLDGLVSTASSAPVLNVVQNGPLVATWDQGAGRLYAVNVYQPAFASGFATVSAAQVALGGSTLAVLGTNGTLRTTTLQSAGGSLAALSAAARPRAAHLPARAAVAVAPDNTVYVAGGGELLRFPAGYAGRPDVSALPLPAADQLQITTVGDIPVVADQATRTLYLPGSGTTVPLPRADTSAHLALQQPSTGGSVVAVATSRALYSADLATGQLATLSPGHSGDVAAPVQVAGCIHAAWNTGPSGIYVRSCGEPPVAARSLGFTLSSPTPHLVFRVNRGEVVLNDTTDGGVFLVDTSVINANPRWQQLTQPDKTAKAHQKTIDQLRAPLIARPDVQGVRPGRTTVVHVLDNDSGPGGDLLAVTAVGRPDQPGVSVAIAPDAQTVLATVTSSLTTDAHFQYTIDDGHGRTAQAQVTLVPRFPSQNSPPALRPHYHPPALTIASGASLTIPVIGDWRDFDGDPLFADSGHVTATAGGVSVGSDGALSYTAPQTTSGLVATIRYAVSDGIAVVPTAATLTVHVLAAASTAMVAPTAEPDVAQAVVGQPVTLHPLANDLPGADPTNSQAQLALAAPVAAVPAADVTTDVKAGTVTFTAKRPGPFLLGYDAAFGAAPTSRTTIRIQVSPATGRPQPPVAVPDFAVIRGQQPAVVDVLANDYDPQGWVLGVAGAASTDPAIHASVVAQHWLRITSDNPRLGSTATVTYTVTDGYRTATGTVSVTAAAASPGPDQITTRDDSVVIRAGDSAAVPVLANDSSSTALPLSLAGIAPTAAPAIAGLLASNQGGDVRVTAPASVTSEQETTVSYVAADTSGAVATGHLHVTIDPLPSPAHRNQPPSPENVATRETAGDIVLIRIPTYGIDPDGDTTAVTAVTAPPSLGRIVSIGPGTIAYQSYPASAGTDSFTYQVTDPYGATGTADVQVGILPPGPPQPPVAVDDVVSAPPGAALHLDVLANDYLAPGDPATVIPLARTNGSLPAGVRLIGSFVYLHAPAHTTDRPLDITYGVTDGSAAPSLGHVIVRAVAGAKLPPIARDDTASSPPGSRTVTVDVLRNDDDPAGSRADLRVTTHASGVAVHGGSLTIPVTTWPREVPYQVTAPDGLTATAAVSVPGSAASVIRLRHGARITLSPRGTATVPLSSVLADAAGRQLKITTLDRLTASPPGDIAVDAHQASAFVVRALGRYTGPGAVSVQVYDGTSLQDPQGHTATVTIPVQVGPDVPLLRCPRGSLPVIQGGIPQTYDVGLLCHVWVDASAGARNPRYTVAWTRAAGGVSAGIVNGTGLRFTASSGAHPGTAGTVRLSPAGGGAGGQVGITVVPAPLPTSRPVTIAGVQAGRPVQVNLAQYVTSPLAQAHIQVLNVTHPANAAVTASGPMVTITPAAGTTHGTITVVASVTDAPGRAGRRINVVITVNVEGRPGAPGQPSVGASSGTLVVSFGPAAANGAPVDHYTVFANGAPHTCPASPCTVTGLRNGTAYDLYVTAHNSVGDGPPSSHVKATPDQVPDQVPGLKTTPGDTQIGLSWQPAVVNGTAVTKYLAEISPAPPGQPAIHTLGGAVTATTFTGLVNGTTYSFRVDAVNARGPGPWSASVTDIPYGKPLTMPAPAAAGAAVPNPATTRAITVSWAPASDNGSPITGYTVRQYQAPGSGGPWSPVGPPISAGTATSTSLTAPTNGSWYEYTVTAANQAGSSGESPRSAPVQAAAPPDAPGNLSAKDHDSGSTAGYNGALHVDFTVPRPNSAQLASVQYGLNGASVSGTWNSPGAPGSSVEEAITGLTNGTSYAVYVRGCNDAGLCGPWAGPSNQVTPYGPPGAPAVSAQQNGTSINYSWGGGGGNGRPVDHYHVCFDGGSCTDTGAGATTKTYGYGQTHTITAYVIDSAGQQSPTASAAASTVAAPNPSVSVARGNHEVTTTGGNCTTSNCYNALVTVSNFPASTVLNYACSDNYSGQFWPYSGTIDRDWNGNVVSTNGSGSTSFYTQCIWGYWSNAGYTITVTVNGTSGSYAG